MFATIAPRWPRAFSFVGFGAVAVYLVVFVLGLGQLTATAKLLVTEVSRLTETQLQLAGDMEAALGDVKTSETQINELQLRSDAIGNEISRLEELIRREKDSLYSRAIHANFEVSGERSSLIIGAFLLFISYVVGQICIAGGRLIIFLRMTEEIQDSRRLARVALYNNVVLTDEFERYNSSVDILAGICVLPLVVFIAELVQTLSFTSFEAGTFFSALLMTLASLRLSRDLSRRVGRRLDAVLDSYATGDVQTFSSLPKSDSHSTQES